MESFRRTVIVARRTISVVVVLIAFPTVHGIATSALSAPGLSRDIARNSVATSVGVMALLALTVAVAVTSLALWKDIRRHALSILKSITSGARCAPRPFLVVTFCYLTISNTGALGAGVIAHEEALLTLRASSVTGGHIAVDTVGESAVFGGSRRDILFCTFIAL
jgi:hypothetical protein